MLYQQKESMDYETIKKERYRTRDELIKVSDHIADSFGLLISIGNEYDKLKKELIKTSFPDDISEIASAMLYRWSIIKIMDSLSLDQDAIEQARIRTLEHNRLFQKLSELGHTFSEDYSGTK